MQSRKDLAEAGRRKLEEFRKAKSQGKTQPAAVAGNKAKETASAAAPGSAPVANGHGYAAPTTPSDSSAAHKQSSTPLGTDIASTAHTAAASSFQPSIQQPWSPPSQAPPAPLPPPQAPLADLSSPPAPVTTFVVLQNAPIPFFQSPPGASDALGSAASSGLAPPTRTNNYGANISSGSSQVLPSYPTDPGGGHPRAFDLFSTAASKATTATSASAPSFPSASLPFGNGLNTPEPSGRATEPPNAAAAPESDPVYGPPSTYGAGHYGPGQAAAGPDISAGPRGVTAAPLPPSTSGLSSFPDAAAAGGLFNSAATGYIGDASKPTATVPETWPALSASSGHGHDVHSVLTNGYGPGLEPTTSSTSTAVLSAHTPHPSPAAPAGDTAAALDPPASGTVSAWSAPGPMHPDPPATVPTVPNNASVVAVADAQSAHNASWMSGAWTGLGSAGRLATASGLPEAGPSTSAHLNGVPGGEAVLAPLLLSSTAPEHAPATVPVAEATANGGESGSHPPWLVYSAAQGTAAAARVPAVSAVPEPVASAAPSASGHTAVPASAAAADASGALFGQPPWGLDPAPLDGTATAIVSGATTVAAPVGVAGGGTDSGLQHAPSGYDMLSDSYLAGNDSSSGWKPTGAVAAAVPLAASEPPPASLLSPVGPVASSSADLAEPSGYTGSQTGSVAASPPVPLSFGAASPAVPGLLGSATTAQEPAVASVPVPQRTGGSEEQQHHQQQPQVSSSAPVPVPPARSAPSRFAWLFGSPPSAKQQQQQPPQPAHDHHAVSEPQLQLPPSAPKVLPERTPSPPPVRPPSPPHPEPPASATFMPPLAADPVPPAQPVWQASSAPLSAPPQPYRPDGTAPTSSHLPPSSNGLPSLPPSFYGGQETLHRGPVAAAPDAAPGPQQPQLPDPVAELPPPAPSHKAWGAGGPEGHESGSEGRPASNTGGAGLDAPWRPAAASAPAPWDSATPGNPDRDPGSTSGLHPAPAAMPWDSYGGSTYGTYGAAGTSAAAAYSAAAAPSWLGGAGLGRPGELSAGYGPSGLGTSPAAAGVGLPGGSGFAAPVASFLQGGEQRWQPGGTAGAAAATAHGAAGDLPPVGGDFHGSVDPAAPSFSGGRGGEDLAAAVSLTTMPHRPGPPATEPLTTSATSASAPNLLASVAPPRPPLPNSASNSNFAATASYISAYSSSSTAAAPPYGASTSAAGPAPGTSTPAAPTASFLEAYLDNLLSTMSASKEGGEDAKDKAHGAAGGGANGNGDASGHGSGHSKTVTPRTSHLGEPMPSGGPEALPGNGSGQVGDEGPDEAGGGAAGPAVDRASNNGDLYGGGVGPRGEALPHVDSTVHLHRSRHHSQRPSEESVYSHATGHFLTTGGSHAALGGCPGGGRAQFSALQQHIDELTEDKLALQRGLQQQVRINNQLAEENEELTRQYNARGAAVEELERKIKQYEQELEAQALSLEGFSEERQSARTSYQEASSRAQALASEVVGLEAQVLQLKSAVLKAERAAEEATQRARKLEKQVESLTKEAAARAQELQQTQLKGRNLVVMLKQTEAKLQAAEDKLAVHAAHGPHGHGLLLPNGHATPPPVPVAPPKPPCVNQEVQCELGAELAAAEAEAAAEAAAAAAAAEAASAAEAAAEAAEAAALAGLRRLARSASGSGDAADAVMADGTEAGSQALVSGSARHTSADHSRPQPLDWTGARPLRDAPSAVVAERALAAVEESALRRSATARGQGLPEGLDVVAHQLARWLPAGPIGGGDPVAVMVEEELRLMQSIHELLDNFDQAQEASAAQIMELQERLKALTQENDELRQKLGLQTQRLELQLQGLHPSSAPSLHQTPVASWPSARESAPAAETPTLVAAKSVPSHAGPAAPDISGVVTPTRPVRLVSASLADAAFTSDHQSTGTPGRQSWMGYLFRPRQKKRIRSAIL